MIFFSVATTGLALLGAATVGADASMEEMRSLIGPDLIGPSFSEQVDEAYKKVDEEVAEKKNEIKSESSDQSESEDSSGSKSFKVKSSESYSSVSLSSSSDENKSEDRFKEGMCNPNGTSHQVRDICEDLFMSLCNPDDILPADDKFCDWAGFTADVDWNDSGDFDELLYAKYGSTTLPSSSTDVKSLKDDFRESMCAPESTKPHHELLCEDIWMLMCAPDVEMSIEDDFCDWVGFTADVDWNYSKDEEDYDSSDAGFDWRKRRNLRG